MMIFCVFSALYIACRLHPSSHSLTLGILSANAQLKNYQPKEESHDPNAKHVSFAPYLSGNVPPPRCVYICVCICID